MPYDFPSMKILLAGLACAALCAAAPPGIAAAPVEQGKIAIPRLGVEGKILEGSSEDVLRIAVGHIPGTALPGKDGNSVLAAHRYGYFKGLRRVRKGDEITVSTPTGRYRYAVDHIEIVEITDVDVLAPTPTPTLTLVTCYPFDYVGEAPQRLIVKAHLLGGTASASPGPASEPGGSISSSRTHRAG